MSLSNYFQALGKLIRNLSSITLSTFLRKKQLAETEDKPMMLAFMPWCPIDTEYDAGEIVVLPFDRNKPIQSITSEQDALAKTIMACYRDINGNPVERMAMIKFKDKGLLDCLGDDEITQIRDTIQLVCFSGLSRREYFRHDPYCNTDCFQLFIQSIKSETHLAIFNRRREGHNFDVWPIEKMAFSMPVHAHLVRKVLLNQSLLTALVSHKSAIQNTEWALWQDSISFFNQANTDNSIVTDSTEWVHLSSAIQRILKANTNHDDVAQKFADTLLPMSSLDVSQSNRLSVPSDKTLRYEWMSEFYKVRGDHAHGRSESFKPQKWTTMEHLFLAAFSFPLLVKRLISSTDLYEMTDEDLAFIEMFESFSDHLNFLREPEDSQNSYDSHFSRILLDTIWEVAAFRAASSLEKESEQ